MAGRNEAATRKKGSKRMKELGYKKVEVWLDAAELAAVVKRWPYERLASLLRRLAVEGAGLRFHYR
jgi:ribosomal protein S19E (S16A)